MFPQLKNKKFQDLVTGRVVMVTDQFEDVAILEGKQRMSVKRLMDKSAYSEVIDPETFFSQASSLQALAEKIRSIPNEELARMEDGRAAESLVIMEDPEEEKRRILEKYSTPQQQQPLPPSRGLEQYMEEDPDIILVGPQPQFAQTPAPAQPAPRPAAPPSAVPHSASPADDDPMVRIFRGAKRKTDLHVTVSFDTKVPRPDFIEMMEDSYETSIIDFLADEFTDQILSDPARIRDAVRSEIMALVYPDGRDSDADPAPAPAQSIEAPEQPASPAPKKKTKTKNDPSVVD